MRLICQSNVHFTLALLNRLNSILLLTFLVCLSVQVCVKNDNNPTIISIPNNWPKPFYDFEKNPLNHGIIALGRKLFYDPILSLDNTISCASCHLSFTAFTHVDHALSHGIGDSIGTRNSPVLINLAWSKHFMWDGAVNHIDVQAIAPITHPAEMVEDLENVIRKLNKDKLYPKLFKEAFGSETISSKHLLKSLAQFQLTLISADSKYDKVKRKEEHYSKQEKLGYKLFQKNCASCHIEPLFTSGNFENNGLPVDPYLKDEGRSKITLVESDKYKFKVPTLRNIEFSFPYMHDGRFKSLREVLDHYTDHFQETQNISPLVQKGITLSSNDKSDLIAFLLTLSDKKFLFNPDFQFPRD